MDFPEPYDPWIITCLASEISTFICCGVNNKYVCFNCSGIFLVKFGRTLLHDCTAIKHRISAAILFNEILPSSGFSKSTNFSKDFNQYLQLVSDSKTLYEGLNKSQKLHSTWFFPACSSFITTPITVAPVTWRSLL